MISKKYIEECIDSYEETINRKIPTPSRDNLFGIDDLSQQLTTDRVSISHHIVAKLLYVFKRTRLDIDRTIAFMCTRVSKSTQEDWIKLRRLLEYLKCTIDEERIIGITNIYVMKTYVDASYATHRDMKGHTGGLTTFGAGIIHHKSKKQSLNTKSSTESEFVGASDYLPYMIWIKYIIRARV